MFAAFITSQLYQGEYAMIIPRIFKEKFICTGALYQTFFNGAYFAILYYLPIYFQSVKNVSPTGSGVRMIALIVPLTIAAISQGFLFIKIRRVPIFCTTSGAIGAIACGLFYTMDAATSSGRWIGYQILAGSAIGFTGQVSLQNAQVQMQPEDLSQATAIINFFLTLGGALLISAAQCGFNELVKFVVMDLPEVSIVVDGYVSASQVVFAITVAAFGIAMLIHPSGGLKKLDAEAIKKAGGGAA